MKKAVLGILFVFAAMFLVGCAKTTATDTFRFETRDVEVYVGEEKSLGIIMGDNDAKSTIIYRMEAISNEYNNPDIPASSIVALKGGDSTYYYRDTTRGKNEILSVIGKMVGSVKITAYIQGNEKVTDMVTVTVKKPKLTAYKINIAKTAITIGDEISAFATTYPDNLKADAEFYTETPDIISVSSRGTITALAPGKAILCAKSIYDESIVAKIELTVIDSFLTSITLKAATANVLLGNTYDLGVTFNPRKPAGAVTYKVDDPAIVSVSEDGIVTGLAAGTTKVTVTCANKSASCEITVAGDFETGIEVDEFENNTIVLKKGEETSFSYEITPATANQLANVTIGDEELVSATVTRNLVTIKGLEVGLTKLTISTYCGLFTKEIYVQVEYADAESIKFSPSQLNCKVDGDNECKITITPAGALQQVNMEIKSGAEFFSYELLVNENGISFKIHGIAPGEGEVEFTSADGKAVGTIKIKVAE